jgi:hypothetical protein
MKQVANGIASFDELRWDELAIVDTLAINAQSVNPAHESI